MKKRIIIAAYVIAGVIFFKFAFTYFYNEWVISKYEEGDYTENFNLLEVANVNEPYIVYYNNGNVLYQRQDYELAIEYYETALDNHPPEGKECPIRINLVLAKLELLGDDCFTPEKIDHTIDELYDCLDILSEEGCATDDDDGHDNRAQRLYNEIKEMLEQAEQEQQEQQQQQQQQQQQSDQSDQSNQSDQSDSSDSNNGNNGSDTTEDPAEKSRRESQEARQQEIEEEMDRRMSTANDQRQRERKKSQAEGDEWNFFYDEIPVW